MKCSKCHKEIPIDQELEIIGTAHVKGRASLKEFVDSGIIWTAGDSWDEQAKCPHCGWWNATISAEVRS